MLHDLFLQKYDEVDNSGFLSFGTVARTIQTHYLRIVAFFRNCATNAASESFNAKIKQFRAQLRGVRDISFFIFRYSKFMLKSLIPQDFGMIRYCSKEGGKTKKALKLQSLSAF